MKKEFINEAKRFQKLAGLITEQAWEYFLGEIGEEKANRFYFG